MKHNNNKPPLDDKGAYLLGGIKMRKFTRKKENLPNRKYKSIGIKILAIVLIIIGTVFIIYPGASRRYNDAKQRAIMEEYLKAMGEIDVIDGTDEDAYIIDDETDRSQNLIDLEDEKILKLKQNWPVETILFIEKIDLFVPVIKGATKQHLNVSVASVNNTGKPWHGSNYVIAGHRSRTFGRHFNRLDELEIDDEILIIGDKNNRFKYKIFSKEIIHQTEISVMENSGKSELTLITCHPANVSGPSTRLVVKAIQVY